MQSQLYYIEYKVNNSDNKITIATTRPETMMGDTAVAVNQGGKRKGAMCGYLETWHLDIEEFLDLRKNTGDERRRTHDMNTANWVPDLFMKRVEEDKNWTLFSPGEAPELHDLIGKDFENKYEEYISQRVERTSGARVTVLALANN